MDPAKLAEPMLLALLAQHYTEIERRVGNAINQRDDKAGRQLAVAAFDLFLSTCDAAVAATLEARRDELVDATVKYRAAVGDAVYAVGQKLDRPIFTGPVNVAFNALRRINLVVVGTPGVAFGYARMARDQFLVEAPVIDSSGGWAAVEGRNAVFYGTADAPMIKDILAESGWQVTPTHVAFGDRKIEGDRLALIACRARPSDPTLADVIYTCVEEQVLIGINTLHHGPSDFVIGRRTNADRYQILRRGNFAKGPEGQLLTTLPTS